jgi:t-SNARE complex subunit (syntaxin)
VIFKSKVCDSIVSVLRDNCSIDSVDLPSEIEDLDEKHRQQLTSWFESTRMSLRERVENHDR